jgi:hypothetical protein
MISITFVEAHDDAMPVAQDVEQHHRHQEDGGEKPDQQHPAARDLRQQDAEDVLVGRQVLGDCRAGVLEVEVELDPQRSRQPRQQAGPGPFQVVRHLLQQGAELALHHGHHDQHEDAQDGHQQEQHDGNGQPARQPAREAVHQRQADVGEDRGKQERAEDRRSEVDEQARDGGRGQVPEQTRGEDEGHLE